MVLIDGAMRPRYNTRNFYGKALNDPDRGESFGLWSLRFFHASKTRGQASSPEW